MSAVIGMVAVIGAGLALIRVAQWHRTESDFWSRIALIVRLDPALDARYRPVLKWAQENPPGFWEKVSGWRSPEVRMGREDSHD